MNRSSILELLSASIHKFRSSVAIEWQDTRISYDELETRSNQIASRLISAGAGKGTPVVVLLENSLHVIPALIGILKAGCVFVPLDLNNPEKRLEAMLSLVKPQWFIIEQKFVELLDRVMPATDHELHLIQFVDGELQSSAAAELGPRLALTAHEPDDLCYISFTSGSTGNPKAIAGRLKASLTLSTGKSGPSALMRRAVWHSSLITPSMLSCAMFSYRCAREERSASRTRES
jgi:acyl-CoA synthetase (AMP-forming)/AMP-acid ligase II